MKLCRPLLKCVVASFLATVVLTQPSLAQEDEIEALLNGLQTADPAAAAQIEQRIYQIWSQSGSPSMDLLLERGREALTEGDTKLAIEHFSALVDHAPEFAEGYNARATAYFQEGRLGLSLDDIRNVLILNPDHFSALSGLALILEQMGQPEAALEAWREVEKLHPNRDGLADAKQRLEREVEGRSL